ncbi:hypothetical protein M011DRAFT_154393 [Sporormia fimetaria CBS 119925]|uniref:Uncharacterized protein n=1 Tax=Sporormia fimetaria CBS 119925 TaxID=1340428 RepID=A0A6A6V5I4_9PLEO|nr:hypothetical protein M011DRAFT_154393 [Sporormia fimetaria CBS 119925]
MMTIGDGYNEKSTSCQTLTPRSSRKCDICRFIRRHFATRSFSISIVSSDHSFASEGNSCRYASPHTKSVPYAIGTQVRKRPTRSCISSSIFFLSRWSSYISSSRRMVGEYPFIHSMIFWTQKDSSMAQLSSGLLSSNFPNRAGACLIYHLTLASCL